MVSSLVHHYLVFGQSVAHTSLRGKFMAKLRSYTIRAEAEASWESSRLSIRKTQLPAVSDTLRSSDNESPVCKTRRAVSPVVPEVSAGATSSTTVSSVTSYAGAAVSYDPLAWQPRWSLYGGQPPTLPVSMPLPRFANKDFVPSPLQSVLVAAQPYPTSPESRASTVCVDLDAFAS